MLSFKYSIFNTVNIHKIVFHNPTSAASDPTESDESNVEPSKGNNANIQPYEDNDANVEPSADNEQNVQPYGTSVETNVCNAKNANMIVNMIFTIDHKKM